MAYVMAYRPALRNCARSVRPDELLKQHRSAEVAVFGTRRASRVLLARRCLHDCFHRLFVQPQAQAVQDAHVDRLPGGVHLHVEGACLPTRSVI